ncbi:MAG TPA: DNA translocase FtsK [Anaerolineaceae bacterium]|nr:DNA translocase FtsK [Anaerolineaceae bacterium]
MGAAKKTSQKTTRGISSPTKNENPPVETHEAAWLNRFTNLASRFSRFGYDFLAVVFFAFGLVTLLGLLKVTQGAWLSPWTKLLQSWLGWGSYLIPITAAAIGWRAAARRWMQPGAFPLGQVLSLEGLVFCGLALLSIANGASLERAEIGLDGGMVGWGLAEFPIALGLSPLLRTIFFAGLFLVFLLISAGFQRWLVQWVDGALEHASQAEFSEPFSFGSDADPSQTSVEVEPAEEAVQPPLFTLGGSKKPVTKLPPEFRKSFRVQPAAEEEPVELKPRDDRLPPLNLLMGEQSVRPDERHINLTAGLIEKTLAEFGIPAKVIGFRIGPTVTQFAVEPGFIEKPVANGEPLRQKVRVSQISGLSRDMALALSAERLRIEAPVPGRSYVGIEVPNTRTTVVRLRPILESEAFAKVNSPLAMPLGRDVSGGAVVADLARMPHVLIAGTTGSGKSVCIEAITACLVANNTPEDLRLAMIDPKMVELVRFNGLPHLLGKVETDLERILGVLRWALAEMEHRYRLLESAHTRDIEAYNRKMSKRKQATLPRIVLLIDELADLMMSAPDQTEHSLVRLAQMARATGIHLVVATQRPSTDVVTGLIKANVPARIAFTVASSIDSRVILDTTGAETLLGRGDLLFLNPEAGTPLRAQGVYVTDPEIDKIIEFWQRMWPVTEEKPAPWEELMNQDDDSSDRLIEQAIEVVRGEKRASASLLQRRLRVGYPRAARLIDELEDLGVVGPSQGGGRDREVLIGPDDDAGDADDIEE